MISRYFQRTREWYAVPWCHGESVLSHAWYHFFSAVLLPLLELARERIFDPQTQRIYILSCGRYDVFLEEIRHLIPIYPIPELRVLNYMQRAGAEIDQLTLDSLESYVWKHGRFGVRPVALDGERFRRIAEYAKQQFPPGDTTGSDVLFLERATGIAGHGAEIRSITNSDDIVTALRSDGHSVERVSLEGLTLAAQISLFHTARIVIGQHGAGLANLIWTQPGWARLIEIVPPNFRKSGWHYFEVLSEALGIPRAEIPQLDQFAPVPIEAIIQGVRSFRESDRIVSVSRPAAF